jgi:hypothetical protein
VAADPEELFDRFVAGELTVDRHDVYARLRAERPIFFSEPLDSWVLTRYDDVLASANRDEQHFPDSRRFDPERWIENAERQFVAGGKILPFGSGRHHCAGSRLAATEMIHGIRELADRVAWLEPDGELPVGEGLMLNSPERVPVVLHAAG